jgi:peptidoglycan/LPS O-acetylase OafA/YrhL
VAPCAKMGRMEAQVVLKPASAPRFYANLESIRGLAALSVVFVHCLGAFRATAYASGLGATALAIFSSAFNGRNAVVLFFVLSGFVLYESIRGAVVSARLFLSFMIRRAFRIIPIAYAGLTLAALYVFLSRPNASVLATGADWFVRGFDRLTFINVFFNFVFLENGLDVVYWTLSVELIASLLFVPLSRIGRIGGWATQVALQGGLLAVSYRYVGRITWIRLLWLPILPGFFVYFFCFHLGILVNRLRHDEGDSISLAGGHGKRDLAAAVVGATMLCCAHSMLGPWLAETLPFAYKSEAAEIWLEALGSCLIVYGCSGRANRIVDRVLGSRVMRYLGRLSFGIYALHVVVLKPLFVLIVSRFGDHFSTFPLMGSLLALSTVVPLSIALAHLLNVLVEAPAIRLGRNLVRRARLTTADRGLGDEALTRPGAAT